MRQARAIRRDKATMEAEVFPWIPAEIYPNASPKTCPCGHHEGWHSHAGSCWHARDCGCTGLPAECFTPLEAFRPSGAARPTP